MAEELRRDNVSFEERGHPDFEQARDQAAKLEDEEVFDAEGRRVGRITKSFLEEGRIVGCEVRLDGNLTRALGIEERTLEIKPEWIGRIEDGVRLNRSAEQFALPEHERAAMHEGHEDGAPGQPRSIR